MRPMITWTMITHYWELKFKDDCNFEICFLNSFQRTLYLNARAKPGRYFILVHFFQPQYLAFKGSVIVSHSDSAVASIIDFRYCPHVTGCRSVGVSSKRASIKERISVNLESALLLTITIPDDKSVWIVSIHVFFDCTSWRPCWRQPPLTIPPTWPLCPCLFTLFLSHVGLVLSLYSRISVMNIWWYWMSNCVNFSMFSGLHSVGSHSVFLPDTTRHWPGRYFSRIPTQMRQK